MARTQKPVNHNQRASLYFVTNALGRYREDNDFVGITRKVKELLFVNGLKKVKSHECNVKRLLAFYMYHEYHGNPNLLPTYNELNYF
jgi:hypothetical protein